MQTICFTGRRNAKGTPELKERFAKQLKTLIDEGAEIFLVGNGERLGFDMCSYCSQM